MPTQTFFNLKQEKRDKIIAAAFDEFAARRLEEANISNIVRKSGIARGSFYQYFKNKEDLYLYLFSIIGEEKMKYLGDITQKREQLPWDGFLLELYEKGFQFAREHPQYIAFGRNSVLTDNRIIKSWYEENKETLADFFKDLIQVNKAKGLIREEIDSGVLSQLLSYLTQDFLGLQFLAGEKDSDDVIEDLCKLFAIISGGIAPKEEGGEE